MKAGRVVRVAGPVVVAEGLARACLYDVVRVGPLRLIGEIIRLAGDEAVIQVYEETAGLRVGSEVHDTGGPFQVELGPGLLGGIFDGVQRPLPVLAGIGDGTAEHPFLRRGHDAPPLDPERRWGFEPKVGVGDRVTEGDVLAEVQETPTIRHRVLVPPGVAGRVSAVGTPPARLADPVVEIEGHPIPLVTRWPVRKRRPVARRLGSTLPLVTGQRVVDTLFPLAKGGSATIPGGFGTGKTVLEQNLAKWSDADVVVYVGCGERGNEMAEVLEEFPGLTDPTTGASLMDRTVLIANTSNMPVAAREASVYTAITIAEYYRDQGYHVALLADSTSRWGEALREVSSRLEEMPGEEGYPAYLPSRLAEFYERSGAVQTLGDPPRTGSVSVVGAVSPPGGDFSEPVTQYSLRLAGTFWALDPDLARRRHFPAIHWGRSYSLYDLDPWFEAEVHPDWGEQRRWAIDLLGQEEELHAIVRLLGADILAPEEQVVFRTGRLLREAFLQQSAVDPDDVYCPLSKQFWMLWTIRRTHEILSAAAREGRDPEELFALSAVARLGRARTWPPAEAEDRARELVALLTEEVQAR